MVGGGEGVSQTSLIAHSGLYANNFRGGEGGIIRALSGLTNRDKRLRNRSASSSNGFRPTFINIKPWVGGVQWLRISSFPGGVLVLNLFEAWCG